MLYFYLIVLIQWKLTFNAQYISKSIENKLFFNQDNLDDSMPHLQEVIVNFGLCILDPVNNMCYVLEQIAT